MLKPLLLLPLLLLSGCGTTAAQPQESEKEKAISRGYFMQACLESGRYLTDDGVCHSSKPTSTSFQHTGIAVREQYAIELQQLVNQDTTITLDFSEKNNDYWSKFTTFTVKYKDSEKHFTLEELKRRLQ